MHERLVDDLPLVVDPRQREEVDERHGAPEALLGEHHGGNVLVLLDRRHLGAVAAVDVGGLAVEHRDHLGDRDVEALAGEASPHARIGVEGRAKLVGIALPHALHIKVDGTGDLVGFLRGGGHFAPPLRFDRPYPSLPSQSRTASDSAGRSAFRPWFPATGTTSRFGPGSGIPNGSLLPWTTRTGSLTASSSSIRLFSGLPGGWTGKARQRTASALTP